MAGKQTKPSGLGKRQSRNILSVMFSDKSAEVLWPKLAHWLGADVDTHYPMLGSGKDGYAFDIGDDKVLKITRDLPEVGAAFRLKKMRADDRFFFRVDKLARMTSKIDHKIAYAILMERLDDPDGAWAEFADYVSDVITDVNMMRTGVDITVDTDDDPALESRLVPLNREMVEMVEEYLKQGKVPGTSPLPRNVKPEMIRWLYGVVGELRRMGIKFFDIHRGNVMRRGKDHVLIDLGRSISPPPQMGEIEQIKAYLAEVLKGRR